MKGSLLLYNLKLNGLIFFYRSKQFTDYIYTDILYCKLSKCIGQTPCSYKHYLVCNKNDWLYDRFIDSKIGHHEAFSLYSTTSSSTRPDSKKTITTRHDS